MDSVALRLATILRVEHQLQFACAWDDKVCGPVLVSKGMPAA